VRGHAVERVDEAEYDTLTWTSAFERCWKNASTSSIRMIERVGTLDRSAPIFSSVTFGEASDSTHTLSDSSEASAVTSEVLPVPGGPYSR